MGGVSESHLSHSSDGTLLFQENVSLDFGGVFASVRSVFKSFKAHNYDGVLILVIGDGQTYQYRLRQEEQFDGVAFFKHFETVAENWLKIFYLMTIFKLATEEDFYQIIPSLIKEKFLKLD